MARSNAFAADLPSLSEEQLEKLYVWGTSCCDKFDVRMNCDGTMTVVALRKKKRAPFGIIIGTLEPTSFDGELSSPLNNRVGSDSSLMTALQAPRQAVLTQPRLRRSHQRIASPLRLPSHPQWH